MNLNGPGPQQLEAYQSTTGTWQLCSLDCRMRFMRGWLQVHLEECARLGKPLVIGWAAVCPTVFAHSRENYVGLGIGTSAVLHLQHAHRQRLQLFMSADIVLTLKVGSA